jgi:hypothetical protein
MNEERKSSAVAVASRPEVMGSLIQPLRGWLISNIPLDLERRGNGQKPVADFQTSKRFCPKAQGCEERETLGERGE